MFLSALSLVELENGAARAAKQGKAQGKAWRDWIDGQLLPASDGRILPIDLTFVRRRAALALDHDRHALLVATALEHGLTSVPSPAAGVRRNGVQPLRSRP